MTDLALSSAMVRRRGQSEINGPIPCPTYQRILTQFRATNLQAITLGLISRLKSSFPWFKTSFKRPSLCYYFKRQSRLFNFNILFFNAGEPVGLYKPLVKWSFINWQTANSYQDRSAHWVSRIQTYALIQISQPILSVYFILKRLIWLISAHANSEYLVFVMFVSDLASAMLPRNFT